MLDFLNLSVIPPKINEIHITLIPQVKDIKKIIEYWPISLSNVVSRIASKVLANRLKVVLPSLVRTKVLSCPIDLLLITL